MDGWMEDLAIACMRLSTSLSLCAFLFLSASLSLSALAPSASLVPRVAGQVNSLDDMDAVHRKMEGLGPLHHSNSVRAYEHMPVFETVVVALLEQVRRRGPRLGWA